MELSERLKEVFERHGLQQKSVAIDLEVSPPTVSGWLAGGSAQCGELHLTKIVNVSLSKLNADEKEALLAELLYLRLCGQVHTDADARWTPELRRAAAGALRRLRVPQVPQAIAQAHRTLTDFPEAFYPLTVISGDKRETSASRINLADFGVVSASPAENRWIARLSLRREVEFLTDKVFVLEDAEQLRRRFGNRNLLVIGSPGSNHLARRLHLARPLDGWRLSTPTFRFNVYQQTLTEIEKFLQYLKPKHQRELIGEMGNEENERHLKHWLQYLFTGGIVDPTAEFSVRAQSIPPNLDFGLISLTQNPFSADDRYVCILAAGFHMFGTAHAIEMLSDPENFAHHPFGGVLRVSADQGVGFAMRFDQSAATWDTNSAYEKPQLLEGLEKLTKKVPEMIHLDVEIFKSTLEFAKSL